MFKKLSYSYYIIISAIDTKHQVRGMTCHSTSISACTSAAAPDVYYHMQSPYHQRGAPSVKRHPPGVPSKLSHKVERWNFAHHWRRAANGGSASSGTCRVTMGQRALAGANLSGSLTGSLIRYLYIGTYSTSAYRSRARVVSGRRV
jgi:hypothetical protein